MIIVLDVSASMQIIMKKEKNLFFNDIYQDASWVIAPDLYISEITNVLWKYYAKKILNHDECQQYVSYGIELIDDFFDGKKMWQEVLDESIKYNHSAYDMFYAILARRNNALLVSNDKYLRKICSAMEIESHG